MDRRPNGSACTLVLSVGHTIAIAIVGVLELASSTPGPGAGLPDRLPRQCMAAAILAVGHTVFVRVRLILRRWCCGRPRIRFGWRHRRPASIIGCQRRWRRRARGRLLDLSGWSNLGETCAQPKSKGAQHRDNLQTGGHKEEICKSWTRTECRNYIRLGNTGWGVRPQPGGRAPQG